MKTPLLRKYALVLGLVALGTASQAQSFQILDPHLGTDITNGLIQVNGNNTDQDTAKAYVKNISATAKNIKCKRYEISVLPTTINTFCWRLCYAEDTAGNRPLYPTPSDPSWGHYIPLDAGADTNAFSCYHKPEGTLGINMYRFVFFDGDAPNDSVYVDIEFESGIASVGDVVTTTTKHYPNPAFDQLRVVISDPDHLANSLEIRNVVGQKIRTMSVNSTVVDLPVADMPNGVYFYNVMGRQGILLSKKFVVRH